MIELNSPFTTMAFLERKAVQLSLQSPVNMFLDPNLLINESILNQNPTLLNKKCRIYQYEAVGITFPTIYLTIYHV